MESEIIANDCRTRCREQGIPFFRFSPHLEEAVSAGEVDNSKLISMMIHARQQSWDQGIPELLQLLLMLAKANRRRKFMDGGRSMAGST